MFECTECNIASREIFLDQDDGILMSTRYVLYHRRLDGVCSECGVSGSDVYYLDRNTYVRPIEYLFRLFESKDF